MTTAGTTPAVPAEGASRLADRVVAEVATLSGGRLRPHVARLLTDVTADGYAVFLDLLAGNERASSADRMDALIGDLFEDVEITLEDALALHRHLERVLLREVAEAAPAELAGADPAWVEVAAHRFFNDLAAALADRYLAARHGHDADRAAAEIELLECLLASPPHLGRARHLSRELGVDLDAPWEVAVFVREEGDPLPGEAVAQLRRALWGSVVLVGRLDAGLVVALQRRGTAPEWPDLGTGTVCGCGGTHSDVRGLRESYEEAMEVLDLARRQGLRRLHVDDAWFDRFLIGSLSAEELAERVLAPLSGMAAGRREVTLQTLEAYLDSGGSIAAVADALHLHRQSVNYRMQNVRRLFGTRLMTPNGRLALHIAVKARRLSRS